MPTVDSLARESHLHDDLVFAPRAENASDFIMMLSPLPFSHPDFGVKDGGLTLDIWNAFRLERLMHVRQLAFTQHPFILDMDGTIDEGAHFTHTRGGHVLDVMAVLSLIADNNRETLPFHGSSSPTRLLRVAGLVHDALTPAGGDAIKMIDPVGLDEDANFPRIFYGASASENEPERACRELGVSKRELAEVILGKGTLGTLLDMADKISYVARDTGQFLGFCQDGPNREPYFPEYPHVAELVRKDPWICGWWESVRVKRDYAWVEDGERLGRFLELRLRMFRGLYLRGPRTMDFVLPITVAGYLYRSGKLDREDLLRMTDLDLDRRIAKFCGLREQWELHKLSRKEATMETFPKEEDARTRERELVASGRPFVFREDIQKPLKPATHLLVRRPGRASLERFRDAYPEKTEELKTLCKHERPYVVCSFRENTLPPEHRTALLAYRREQVGLDP